jgi:LacI family transcriptional regulator
VLATTDEDPKAEFEEASRMLRRNMEGLIIIPAHRLGNASLLLAQEFEQLPIVTLDRPIEGSRFDSLLVENEHGAQLGTQHLIRLGHKRIAYIGLSDDLYTMRMRHEGYAVAMEGAGLKQSATFLSGVLDDSREVIRKLLSGSRPPTAVFCANNLITRHVLHGLQAMGMHPPESIALVGFDDFELADVTAPPLTVVRQPAQEMGRVATNLLLDRISRGELPLTGSRIVLPVEVVLRRSCGCKHKTPMVIQ